jgi:hypothetical protein
MFEYLLPDGTALPENEVIKLAIQKGLTKEDYVKRNKLSLRPKQKKAPAKPDRILENINKYNAPKTVGPKEKKYEPVVLGKQESVGDYLTGALRTEKSVAKTFSVEEEEGKKVLEKLYAGIPGLTFEETTSASFGDITNMFDAVKAVYIDPVTGKKIESAPLQFDINVMNASEKERPKLVKANADILKDFFNKNLKNVDLGKNKYLKGLAELEYNKEINNAITPEFRAKVDEEFDAPDLFAPRKEQKVSMAATGQAAMGGTGYTTTIVKPYENELKRSKLKVLADNPGISQKDLDIQADKLTRTLLKTKAFNEQKSLVAEKVINNNPDMQSTLYVGSLLANQAAVKVQNKNIVKLELAKKNASTINGLASDCKAILEGKYKTEDEAIAIANKFASLGIQMDQTQTELVTLKNGNQVSKGFFDAYNKLKEEYSANNLYAQNVLKEQANNLQKLEDSDIFASAASKNYDLSEKYLGTIGLGFSDLMVGGGYFAAKVLDKVTPFSYAGNAISKMIYGDEAETSSERLDKWAVGYNKAVTDIRDSYTRDVSFDDAFATPSNFGKFAAQEISTQIPILTAMVASGGIAGGSAAMIGVTSAGSKMADMQTEIARGSADYSAPEIWLKSIGYGASEIAFESLTTIPILKRAKIALGKGGAEDVIDNGMRAYFKSKTPGFVFDQFLEAAGETGTQVTQNIIDGNPLMQNVDHAAFSGFAMGTVMSGVPYTHGLYLSAFSDYNSKSNIRKLQKEQSALGKQFEAATKKSQKKAISSLMTQKDAEITAAIEKQQKLVNNNLRAGVAENIIKIESKKAELQNEAKDILDNKDISTEVKDLLIQDLRGKFNKLNSIKQSALDPVNMMQDISKFVVLEASDPQRYEDLISRATVSLSSTLKPSEDNIKKTAYDLYLKEEIDTNINNASKVEGANLKVYNTKKEALAAVRNDENISDADKATIIEEVSLGADGYADAANQTQVVIKENMFNNQRTQIASHEIGHYVFDKIFASNPEAFIPIANQLLETTKKIDKKLYDKLVKDTEKGDDNKLKATEVVSRFLELVSKDDISFAEKSDGFLSGLFGSMVQRQFAKQYDFDFKGQTDMFNFVVGLGKKIKSGELTLKEIEAASESKVVEQASNLAKTKTYGKISTSDITPTVFSKAAVEEIQKKIDKLEEQYDNDQIEYDYYENQIKLYEEQLEKAKLQPEVEKPKTEKPKAVGTEESSVREVIKENKGKISSDKVQEIYEKKGTEGALDIIKLFKPITSRIVDKRRDAPGFSEPDLTYEIENGKGGILELIMKYNPEEGVPLAAYINKYLPVRAITASRRVLDKEFTSDVEAEVNVKATETADQGMTVNAPEKPKYKNALESNILEPNVLDSATKKIISTVRLLKNRIDAPVTLNRTVTPLIAEIRDEIGKQLDIDIKTMLGGKKDGVLRSQLLKAKRYILENMTTTWLMGKDGQGGIPQAIQKQIDGKWVSFPDWVGKKIDRETTSTDLAGRTSGAELVRRLPNVFNNVSNEEFLAQIIGPDGNPIRGRKESVSKAMAEEIAFDIINADLADQGPIFEAFTANQERLGVELASNVVNDFIRQSERGNIKFSKTLMQQLNLKQTELANNISINGKMNLSNIRLALINTFPNWEKKDIDFVAVKLTPSMISASKQIKTKKKSLPKDLLSNVVENVANSFDDGVAMRNKFNSNISVAEFFRNPLYRADLRALDLGFSEFILSKFGKEEGLDMLSSLWSPTVAGKTTNGQKAPASIYNGVNDFNQHLEALQRNTGDGKVIDITQKYKKNNTIFNNNFDGTFDKAKDKLKSDKAKELSILAAEWFSKEILKEDNTYGPEHLAAIYTLFIKENNSALRSAAPVVGTIVDKRIKDIKKYDYDHSKPVSYVARRLADKFVYGLDVDLDLLFKDYEVTIIPKTVSKKLSKLGLQSMMPLNYVEGSGNAVRINSATIQAIDRYEEFVNNIDVKQPIIENAVAKSLPFSKTPKGISVFDFDDTVGITSGSVLYTMPGDLMVYHGAPKGKDVTKISDKGVKFFATDKREADEYARMNSGVTQEFLINESDLANEDTIIEKINELGLKPKNKEFEVEDASFYELIDTRFEESLSKADITKLFDALKKDGIKAISYSDGAQVSGRSTTSIAVIDPSIIAAPKKLNAEEFAKNGSKLLEDGAVFDFSEFSKVVDGKPGPMVQKMKKMIGKFGPDNFFILTARPADAAGPIHEFLKSIGINIPLENITGLGNSTAQAKADWITNKAADGYNDFYFADDAIQNVKAVKDALDVLDVKSKIQQAKLKFSKTISSNFNKILEENVGVKAEETFSAIVAKRKGKAIGKYRFFVPPSAADLELLIYDFLGYGETGERQQQFFNKALFEPYANGIALIDAAKQSIKNDYKALLKAFPEVSKELGKLTPDGNFTYDQAIRVSMWAGMGEEVPGISEDEVKELNMFVNQNPDLAAFKAGLIATGRQDAGWVAPTEYWDSESIVSDLHNITDKVGRKKYLAEFIENSKEMFSKENLNKIEAIYGSNFRDALEDSIYSMANGTNRESGPGRINAAWLNWINNSTGAIMFWNTRSAVLQTIGSINYLNWRDNNPLNAAKAFANQPQYWKDFAYIWNSDKMKERRSGLKEDVSSSEIANAAAGTTSKANAIISYLLKKGFLPTQIGDSFAIASGGATFYRNRINYNLKQGMTEAEAESEAWKEFLKVTDQTQQSGDPRDISQQQRSAAGRLVLAFQNTSMQQARLVKKAGLDLVNRRGDAKTNISKIVYYTAVQNIIFGALQNALFATIFSDDDEKEKEKKNQTAKDKWLDIGNNIVDTILRGSGMAGAIVATLKNVYLKYNEESKKGFKAEYAKVLIEAANVAPAIGSKISKGFGAMRTAEFEKDVIAKRGWSVTANGKLNLSPSYSVLGQGVEATTNLPANRFVNKVNNLSEALDSRNKSWQRIALAIGYTPYTVGVKNEENETIKAEAKVFKKQEGLRKAEETRNMTRDSLNNLSFDEFKAYVLKKKMEKIARKDSINNLPKPELDKYLKNKKLSEEFSQKQKDMLELIKLDSLTGLSRDEYQNYLDMLEDKKELAKIERKITKLKKEQRRNIYK